MLSQRRRHEKHIQSIHQKYDKEREQLRKRKVPSNEFMDVDYREHEEIQDAESHMDYVEGFRLLNEARFLDVETPPVSYQEMWTRDDDNEFVWLSAKGRAHVRKLIYEEQGRRLELRAKRFNVWAPIITALTGLAGVILGIIALLHRK